MKSKHLLIFLCALTVFYTLKGQQYLSVETVGSGADIHYITSDSMGNRYIGGTFSGNLTLGGDVLNSSGPTIFIAKSDSLGNYEWALQASSLVTATFKHLYIDPTGNLYVHLFFNDSIQVDTFSYYDLTYQHSLVGKINPDGAWDWVNFIGRVNIVNYGQGLNAFDQGPNGHLYIGETFHDSVLVNGNWTPGDSVQPQSIIAVYDSNGNWISTEKLPGIGFCDIQSVHVDRYGNLLIGGGFADTMTFNGAPHVGPTNSVSMFYALKNAMGNWVWSGSSAIFNTPMGGSSAYVYGIESDQLGNYFILGGVSNSLDTIVIGFDTLKFSNDYSDDLFVAKLDSIGKFQWVNHTRGGPRSIKGIDFALNERGALFVGGISLLENPGDSAVFDDLPIPFDPSATSFNPFIVKMNPTDGSFMWLVRGYGGENDEDIFIMDVSPVNKIQASSLFQNQMSFEGDTLFGDGSYLVGFRDTMLLPIMWPGDMDANGIADRHDLLHLGLAFQTMGPSRADQSNQWAPHILEDWATELSDGSPLHYIDANGDGFINDDDTLAISRNYGLTHWKGSECDSTAPPLYPVLSSDSIGPGDTVYIELYYGTATEPVDSVYGLAFSLNLDYSLIDTQSVSVSFPPSWFGSKGNDLISLGMSLPEQNQIDIAISRTDQSNVSGFGLVSKVTIVMVDDLSGRGPLIESFNCSTQDLYAINVDMESIPLCDGADSLLVIQAGDAIDQPGPEQLIKVYPNPAGSQVWIESPELRIEQAELYNAMGQKITQVVDFHKALIPVAALPNGYYWIRMISKRGIYTKKLWVYH